MSSLPDKRSMTGWVDVAMAGDMAAVIDAGGVGVGAAHGAKVFLRDRGGRDRGVRSGKVGGGL
jgi:hypothetical protein